MKTFELGFGKGTQTISLPAQQVINQVEGNEALAIEDIPAAVIEALRNPNGTPPLQNIVSAGETVCIVVSDLTRAWIRHELILPPLFNELNEAGIPDENIKSYFQAMNEKYDFSYESGIKHYINDILQ